MFHRQRNDFQEGVKNSGLWHAVVMMCVAFNLPFGPWEGQGWFQTIKEMAEEAFQSLSPSNPLFIALYHRICLDMGIEPEGIAEHRKKVFNMIFSGRAYTMKGEKVSLRRWFSWLTAADAYLPLWHSVFLNLICIGQKSCVYKNFRDVPLWNNGTRPRDAPTKKKDKESSSEDEPAGDAAEASAAVAGAASSSALPPAEEDEKAPVKQQSGQKQFKELRAQSTHTHTHALCCSGCRG